MVLKFGSISGCFYRQLPWMKVFTIDPHSDVLKNISGWRQPPFKLLFCYAKKFRLCAGGELPTKSW